jgi:hypothetical protein
MTSSIRKPVSVLLGAWIVLHLFIGAVAIQFAVDSALDVGMHARTRAVAVLMGCAVVCHVASALVLLARRAPIFRVVIWGRGSRPLAPLNAIYLGSFIVVAVCMGLLLASALSGL